MFLVVVEKKFLDVVKGMLRGMKFPSSFGVLERILKVMSQVRLYIVRGDDCSN